MKIECPICGNVELTGYEQQIIENEYEYYQDTGQFEKTGTKKARKQKGCGGLELYCVACDRYFSLRDIPDLQDYPAYDEIKGRSMEELNKFLETQS